MCHIFLYSQEYPSFINLSKNKIIFDKDSSNFYKCISSLYRIKQKKDTHFSIVHYGGSHIQGGFWSESIMTHLQSFLNTNGGGYFVFPFRQIKTNSPNYFKTYSNGKWKSIKCVKSDSIQKIGMCGIMAITDSSCYLSIKNQWEKLKGYTRIKVFYRKNHSYQLIPLFPVQSMIDREYYTEYVLQAAMDSIIFYIQKKDSIASEFVLDGISCENDSAGLYYAGFGVNGATSESFLKCNLLANQLSQLKRIDLFILSMGVNDVRNKAFSKEEYIQHYDSLIQIIQKTHPESSILITTISDNYMKRRVANSRTIKGNEAIMNILKKHQIAVWDLNNIMGGYKSMNKWYQSGLSARDKIHFNKKGYTLLGQLIVEAILQKIEHYK